MSEEKMGIIKNPGYGMRDFHKPGLWFDVYTSESSGSLQCFWGEDAERIIRDSKAYDVKSLSGKPCLVEEDGNLVKFIKVLDI